MKLERVRRQEMQNHLHLTTYEHCEYNTPCLPILTQPRNKKMARMVDGRRFRPSFFKVMVGDFLDKVAIPRAFVKHVLVQVPDKIILRSSPEKSWTVTVMKLGESFVLCKEWWNFAKHHALEYGDFLVFRYDGHADFTVKIFGRHACEKKITSPEERNTHVVPNKRTASMAFTAKEMPLSNKNNTESNGLHGKIIQSCTVTMRPSYVSSVYNLVLPIDFVRNCLKEVSLDVTLRLWNGSEWKVAYKFGAPQGRFIGGWKAFAIDNQLKSDDVCSFQLVSIQGNHAIINVSVARSSRSYRY